MKKILVFSFTILLVLLCSFSAMAAPPEVKSSSAVVIDMDTGQILYEKNGYKINYLDNMTKLLNVSTAIHNGDLNAKLDVTDVSLLETSKDSLAGTLGLSPDDRITLRDALYAEILLNANDAARVVAGNLGNEEGQTLIGDSDDVKRYVSMMKYEARYLGASQMMVSNVMGLNSSDQICTAMDLAYLMYYGFMDTNFRRILTTKTYDVNVYGTKEVEVEEESKNTEASTEDSKDPDNKEDSSEKTKTTIEESLKKSVAVTSTHKMVNGELSSNGVKGGFVAETESSGFHSVTYAKKMVNSGNDSAVSRKVAVIIMNSRSEKSMYQDINTLLNYSYKDWMNFTIPQKKLDNYIEGDVKNFKVLFSEDFQCLIPVDQGKKDLTAFVALDENGHRTGTLTFSLEGENHPLGTAAFYENTNVKVIQPWLKTLIYIGIGLILLVLCTLLYNKILRPFLQMVKEKREKDKKRKENRPTAHRERGYKTAQKEQEMAKKDAEYFNPNDGPERKRRSNRSYTKKHRR